MKRLNPSTNEPFRCGDVHPDTGMVFRGYDKGRLRKNGTYHELWLSPESFEAIRNRMRDRARARRKAEAFRRLRTADQIIAALG